MNTRNLSEQARLELHRINVAMCVAHGGRKLNKGHSRYYTRLSFPLSNLSGWSLICRSDPA